MRNKKIKNNGIYGTLTAITLLFSASSQAASLEIKILNATSSLYFAPFVIAASAANQGAYVLGTPASAGFQTLAEFGNPTPLADALVNTGVSAVVMSFPNTPPNAGFLGPGQSASRTLETTPTQTHLSIAGMVLPSNDAFTGIDNWLIPTQPGVYHFDLDALDAGTAINNELRSSMRLTPNFLNLGRGGTGVATEIFNSNIHVHRGNVGDFSSTAGPSDINAFTQRWLNPVATVTVTVR